MNFETLSFTTFCVGSLADALNMSAGEVYSRLRSSASFLTISFPLMTCYTHSVKNI